MMSQLGHYNRAIRITRHAAGVIRHVPGRRGEVLRAAVHITIFRRKLKNAGSLPAAGGEHRLIASVTLRLAERPEVGRLRPRQVV